MGVLGENTSRAPRKGELAKMQLFLVSTSMVVLAAGSALPHPEMPPLQERGECMAWSWSSATGWKCTQEISTDPVDLDKFRQDSLAAHNAYRAKHGVAALKLSSELNALAQEWADHLIAENAFEHRPNNNNGENIYMSSGRAAQEQAQGAVDSWYSEIKDYTFGKEPSRGGPVTGHFTQVVWKGSSEVVVGVAQKGSKVIVVANYSPPGNYIGQHADNVFPPL